MIVMQKRERGEVDDHQIDERHRHHENAMLELRQHDQDDEHGERQRRRRDRTPQQGQPEEVEKAPGEKECRLRIQIGLEPEQKSECREMNGHKQPDRARVPAVGGGCDKAIPQEQNGGRHD